MPAHRRFDEQPDALLGDRLVQKAIDLAARDLRGKLSLMLSIARDDQHEIRELLAQAARQRGQRPCAG